VPPQELGGILNSSVGKSITDQQNRGVDIRNLLFDIQQEGKKPVGADVPYADRLAKVQSIIKQLTGTVPPDPGMPGAQYATGEALGRIIHGPETTGMATEPAAARQLFQQVRTGQNPYTDEGIVIHPATGKPMKSKIMDEHDVYIRGFVPGKGKYMNRGVGTFVYSHTPKGKIMGEVGTGFSDALREDMWKNQDAYLGRVAKVRSQDKLPSGALRAPALISLHEDYPLAKGASVLEGILDEPAKDRS